MKDTILKSFLQNFCEKHELTDIPESDAFEHFVNYNVISKLYPREIRLDALSTGGSDDIGLDGVAIIVNGNIIQEAEEIDYFIEKNGTLDVVFAFIQSKKSPSFKGEQIANFIFGVKSFFDETNSIPENETIKKLRAIKDKIYQNSISFTYNPELKLFFTTIGEWKEPEEIVGKVNRELQELDEKHLFKNKADIIFYDAIKLRDTFREINRKVVKEIIFNNHVSLPTIPDSLNVRQSYIGSISVTNYLTLISNEDKQLSKELFYDNVRDFQGNNKVNKEIKKTLVSKTEQSLLSIMNNGITIIAKKIEQIGNKMKLTDFQIVNGCQSSHVLFENKLVLMEDTHIILKIIETNDPNITNKIIRATNRQTEVKDEAFESLKTYHKDLQEFYTAKSKTIEPSLYYERRSKEFFNVPTIHSSQIITLSAQIQAYVSVYLAEPQSMHRYFGEVLEKNREKLFNDKGNYIKYYLSALLINRIDKLFKQNKINRQYKQLKYHLGLLVFKLLMASKNSSFKEEDMLKSINDTNKLKNLVKISEKIIEIILAKEKIVISNAKRNKSFTQQMLKDVENFIYNSKNK